MIDAAQLEQAKKIKLPLKREIWQPCHGLVVSRVMREEKIVPAEISAFRCRTSNIHRIKAVLEDGEVIVVETKPVQNDHTDSIDEIWRCDRVFLEDDMLVLDSPSDRKVSSGQLDDAGPVLHVAESWAGGLRYVKEVRAPDGEIQKKGFREPQYAALHALATHWASSTRPATIVLPTGTGKTDVMIGAIVANRCKRTLVIVPTDALRKQTMEKFETYGVLPLIDAIGDDIPFPVMGCIDGAPSEQMIRSLVSCNIVVSTMASLAKAEEEIQRSFADQFTHVFFDEAHHKEAKTWRDFHSLCEPSQLLLMTATPFRQDGKPIGGKFIYNFPLHRAQEQGYFRPIRFREVFEPNELNSDRAIAEAAVECLRRDLIEGKNHLMMARAKTIEDAKRLHRDVYSRFYDDLSPVVLHSQTAGKDGVLKRIKAGEHKIVICVDMLGEGFDLPQLKIAALHAVHKSIGVTLQFIGRFTRDSEGLGDATFVANLAEDGVPESLEGLYQEDADWNLVVSELSYDAISPQAKLSSLTEGLQVLVAEEGINVTPLTLRPKISAMVYRVNSFSPRQFANVFSGRAKIAHAWLNQNGNFLIMITNQADEVEWSDTKDIRLDMWDLHLAYHDSATSLLYINSSRKNGLTKKQLDSIAGNPQLIDGEDVFRAFSGLHRLTLFNVGLIGRSKNVRYQMFAGMDVKSAITPIVEGDKLKCNVSGVGYEEGIRSNVGCSRKGKVWSMSSGSIAEWKDWCDHVGGKLTNSSIQPRDFLKYTLLPENVNRLPPEEEAIGLLVDWPDHLFQSQVFSFEIEHDGTRYPFDVCELSMDEWNAESNHYCFSIIAENEPRVKLKLSLHSSSRGEDAFRVQQLSVDPVTISSAGNTSSAVAYFQENPPLVRLSDGSQMSGDILLKPRESLGETFDRELIQVHDWSATDITKESRWKEGVLRPNSIQQNYIDHLTIDSSITHIIDDDDSGESADIVAIKEVDDSIIVYLWHCKYSGSDTPGKRAKDLYEVCGQAQKSTKWTWSFDRLVKHIKKRDTESLGGRDTRFLKGDYKSLYTLRKASRRKQVSYVIGIIQPGISKSGVPDAHLAVLGATNAFVSCITNHSLLVVASE